MTRQRAVLVLTGTASDNLGSGMKNCNSTRKYMQGKRPHRQSKKIANQQKQCGSECSQGSQTYCGQHMCRKFCPLTHEVAAHSYDCKDPCQRSSKTFRFHQWAAGRSIYLNTMSSCCDQESCTGGSAKQPDQPSLRNCHPCKDSS